MQLIQSNRDLYLSNGSALAGPLSVEQLRFGVESGQLGQDLHLWHEGLIDWISLKNGCRDLKIIEPWVESTEPQHPLFVDMSVLRLNVELPIVEAVKARQDLSLTPAQVLDQDTGGVSEPLPRDSAGLPWRSILALALVLMVTASVGVWYLIPEDPIWSELTLSKNEKAKVKKLIGSNLEKGPRYDLYAGKVPNSFVLFSNHEDGAQIEMIFRGVEGALIGAPSFERHLRGEVRAGVVRVFVPSRDEQGVWPEGSFEVFASCVSCQAKDLKNESPLGQQFVGIRTSDFEARLNDYNRLLAEQRTSEQTELREMIMVVQAYAKSRDSRAGVKSSQRKMMAEIQGLLNSAADRNTLYLLRPFYLELKAITEKLMGPESKSGNEIALIRSNLEHLDSRLQMNLRREN